MAVSELYAQCTGAEERRAFIGLSIRFLELKMSRHAYMRSIAETMRVIQESTWPHQKNRSSIAGGSKPQTNGGLINGCMAKRTFDPQFAILHQKVHAMAACCTEELPYLGMYITMLVKGQGFAPAS